MTMREHFIYKKKKARTMSGNYRQSTNNHSPSLTHPFSSLASKTTNYDNLRLFFFFFLNFTHTHTHIPQWTKASQLSVNTTSILWISSSSDCPFPCRRSCKTNWSSNSLASDSSRHSETRSHYQTPVRDNSQRKPVRQLGWGQNGRCNANTLVKKHLHTRKK